MSDKSVAICKCGDYLTRCDIEGSEAAGQFKFQEVKSPIGFTFYCFGCNKFYYLGEVK